MTFVKICGLTDPSHTEAAVAGGAAFIGLVFAERSRRHVSVQDALRVIAPLGPRAADDAGLPEPAGRGPWFRRCATALGAWIGHGRPLVVGVFADQPPALVNAIAEAVDIDLVQLSGNERWDLCLQLRRPVIKTVRTEPGSTARMLERTIEAGMAHLIHLDAYVPGELGGTGRTAAWDVAARLAAEMPLMLAGGLTAANVAEAMRVVRPWAVDVSSGVERDGVKDPALIEAFLWEARRAGERIVVHDS